VEAVVELLRQTKEHEKNEFLKVGEGFSGQTALHLAANNGHAEVVRALLEHAPDPGGLVTATDRPGGFTPLHLAAELGHEEVAKALLEGAPDRTLPLSRRVDKWCGFTALHLAAYKGHETVAKTMLNLSWDRVVALEAEDTKNRTPAQLAAERGEMEVSNMLANFPTLR
jgi:ankyrin repeat protein